MKKMLELSLKLKLEVPESLSWREEEDIYSTSPLGKAEMLKTIMEFSIKGQREKLFFLINISRTLKVTMQCRDQPYGIYLWHFMNNSITTKNNFYCRSCTKNFRFLLAPSFLPIMFMNIMRCTDAIPGKFRMNWFIIPMNYMTHCNGQEKYFQTVVVKLNN